jgi:hypothetical protein
VRFARVRVRVCVLRQNFLIFPWEKEKREKKKLLVARVSEIFENESAREFFFAST